MGYDCKSLSGEHSSIPHSSKKIKCVICGKVFDRKFPR